jgi:hypothetical protein
MNNGKWSLESARQQHLFDPFDRTVLKALLSVPLARFIHIEG